MNVTVIGLGKLGSPMAACFAAKGHHVRGCDLNEKFVRSINEGKAPVYEPGLQEMLDKSGGRLSATTDVVAACRDADIVFMIVPTPSGPDGTFTPEYILDACRSVGEAFQSRRDFPVAVVTSTLMPGCTGSEVKSLLESATGGKCGFDFGLSYSPEFISLGSVIRDFLNPDFLLIGESDSQTGDKLVAFYETVCDNKPRVARMSFTNAELTKLALNAYVTTKISYANMLAELCEQLEGGDVDAVTGALGMDTRIGAKYLKGAIGFGGPCFPRDNAALMTLASNLGVYAPLPQATDRINNHQLDRLGKAVEAHLSSGSVLGVLGLSYKPCTNVIEKSQAVILAAEFSRRGSPVIVFDPCAMDAAKSVLPGSVRYASSAGECARATDVLLICTPSSEYKAISADDLKRPAGKRATVIDCWRMLDRQAISAVANYIRVGTADMQSKATGLRIAA